MEANNNTKGIFFIMTGMAFFSIQDSLIKFIFEDIALFELYLGRTLIQATILLAFVIITKKHITYNQELIEGDEVELNLIHFDHDKKRIQYKFEMVHKEKKYLASTIEVLALYVDLKERKVAEFEKEKVDLMAKFISENKHSFKSENLIFSNKLKK